VGGAPLGARSGHRPSTGRIIEAPSARPQPENDVTPDGRYAFVSNEAVGATRGTVDVIDLAAGAVAASVALHYQPGGLGFWKMEDGGR
jgi:DNA-binding beta-propeller fold protein YncE